MSDSGTRASCCLELQPHPSSASAARRWVRQQLHAVGHDELAESAELATSELVTNAVLHAQTVVTVSLDRQAGRWRFWIGDRSPGVVKLAPQLEGQTRAWGHGLRILDSVSHSWGVEQRPPGKRVWFEPRGMTEQGAELHPASTDLRPDPDAAGAVLREAPVSLLRQARQRMADVHREMVLMAYALEVDPDAGAAAQAPERPAERHGSSQRLAELARAIAPITELATQAPADAAGTATITCTYPEVTTSDELGTWPDLLDEVDGYCRAQELLTLGAPRLEAMARRWFLTEVARQRSGRQPRSWPKYVATH